MNGNPRLARLRPAAIALAALAVIGTIALTAVRATDSAATAAPPKAPVTATAASAATPATASPSVRIDITRPPSTTPVPVAALNVAPRFGHRPGVPDGGPSPIVDQPTSPIASATARFHDIARAEAAGYVPFTDVKGVSCIAMPGMGAMGVHYVNPKLISDPAIDPTAPEALVYTPDRDGTLHLAALEFLVDKAAWDRKHHTAPELFHGQPFATTAAPNRYGLPTFYSQHLWLWKANPAGPLAMWNPAVSCAWA